MEQTRSTWAVYGVRLKGQAEVGILQEVQQRFGGLFEPLLTGIISTVLYDRAA